MGRPAEGLSPVLKRIQNHHKSMARDYVSGGLRNQDLAELYGMLPPQISIIINSPLFQAECLRLTEAAEDELEYTRQGLRDLAPKAKQIITEELHKEAETMAERRFRMSVASDLLDRVGVHKKPAAGALHIHKHEEVHVSGMSNEELQDDVFDLLG